MKNKTKQRSPKRRPSHPEDKKSKRQYRIRNWAEYNAALVRRGSGASRLWCVAALVRRGSLTVWLDEEATG